MARAGIRQADRSVAAVSLSEAKDLLLLVEQPQLACADEHGLFHGAFGFLERGGYVKAKDLLAWIIELPGAVQNARVSRC